MLAILSAMPDEITAIVDSLGDASEQILGSRRYHRGSFHGVPVVAVFSGWGKVASAATTAELISSCAATQIVFTGVAGAVQHGASIGDVVIGTELIQHDLDASPIFPRYEVPLLGKSLLATDPGLRRRLRAAAQQFLREDFSGSVAQSERDWFGIATPQLIEGLIASGDQFFDSAHEIDALRRRLPQVACVDMEGAAVAQVCEEYSIPFAIVRTLSDSADENAPQDFPRFAREVAGHYSLGILSRFIESRA